MLRELASVIRRRYRCQSSLHAYETNSCTPGQVLSQFGRVRCLIFPLTDASASFQTRLALAGLPTRQLDILQSVLNAAARSEHLIPNTARNSLTAWWSGLPWLAFGLAVLNSLSLRYSVSISYPRTAACCWHCFTVSASFRIVVVVVHLRFYWTSHPSDHPRSCIQRRCRQTLEQYAAINSISATLARTQLGEQSRQSLLNVLSLNNKHTDKQTYWH